MEPAVECTHCGVVMTSWSVPASPVRYFQCPFCQRTHSSHYGEVFRNRAGARVLGGPARAASVPSEIPMARPEDQRWATIRTAANRWYARLEADELRNAAQIRPATVARRPIPLTVALEEPRRRDPLADLEIEVQLDPATAAPPQPPRAAPPAPIQLRVAVGASKRR
jgi:hypothetical protein